MQARKHQSAEEPRNSERKTLDLSLNLISRARFKTPVSPKSLIVGRSSADSQEKIVSSPTLTSTTESPKPCPTARNLNSRREAEDTSTGRLKPNNSVEDWNTSLGLIDALLHVLSWDTTSSSDERMFLLLARSVGLKSAAQVALRLDWQCQRILRVLIALFRPSDDKATLSALVSQLDYSGL
jgi:hypothetical protein